MFRGGVGFFCNVFKRTSLLGIWVRCLGRGFRSYDDVVVIRVSYRFDLFFFGSI